MRPINDQQDRTAKDLTGATKVCTRCLQVLALSSFSRRADSGGLRARCVDCERAYRAEWYKTNREYKIAKSTEWNESHPAKRKESSAKQNARVKALNFGSTIRGSHKR